MQLVQSDFEKQIRDMSQSQAQYQGIIDQLTRQLYSGVPSKDGDSERLRRELEAKDKLVESMKVQMQRQAEQFIALSMQGAK